MSTIKNFNARRGDAVSYEVSKEGYFTKRGTFSLTQAQQNISVSLEAYSSGVTITQTANEAFSKQLPDYINSGCVITEEGVATGFSSSNKITLRQSFPESVSSVKFIANASISSTTSRVLFGADASSGTSGKYFGVSGGMFKLDGSGGVTSLSTSTNYWFGVEWDGTNLKGYLLADDGTYTLDTLPAFSEWTEEWSGTQNIFAGMLFSFGYYGYNKYYWNGSINLSKSKIWVDGEVWWTKDYAVSSVGHPDTVVSSAGKMPDPSMFVLPTENILYEDGVYSCLQEDGSVKEITGCLLNVSDTGQAMSLNAYYVFYEDGTRRLFLSGSQPQITNASLVQNIGQVQIAAHDMFSYDAQTASWTKTSQEGGSA